MTGNFERVAKSIGPTLGCLFVWLVATPARAHVVQYGFCLYTEIEFDPSGSATLGYDSWDNISVVPLEGSLVTLETDPECDGTSNGQLAGSNHLNDEGCTVIASTYHGCVNLRWQATQQVAGNNQVVVFQNGGVPTAIILGVNLSQVWPLFTHTFTDSRSRRLSATVAHIMNHEFLGRLANEEIQIYEAGARCPCTNANGNWACEEDGIGIMCIAEDRNQFTIGHEYGHLAMLLTMDWSMSFNCNGGHTWNSQEYASCAMMEGWAHFVAADIWNDHDESTNPDGYLWYHDVDSNCEVSGNPSDTNTCVMNGTIEPDVVDVETGGCNDGCVNRMMENRYSAATWSGMGTELDWLRAFWDYHTNDTGVVGVVPSHSQMQREWDEMGHLTPSCAFGARVYDCLRLAVASESGCAQYRRLVYYATGSGAAHCEGTCDSVSAFGCGTCDASCCGHSPCP